MSFFTGGKSKDKAKEKDAKEKAMDRDARDGSGKKSQFYVQFLGWMECRGVRGRRYTDPVIQELRRRQKKMEKPPKLTIQLTAKELKITQDFEEKRKRGGAGGVNIRKVTFPTIAARDVTYAVQATRASDNKADDVVACIYLGYMPRTQHFAHVHVYRFDEPSTAATFVRLMGGIVDDNAARVSHVERELADRGEIDDPCLMSSDGMSARTGTDSAAGSVSGTGSAYSEDGSSHRGDSPTFGSDEMEADLQSLSDVRPFDDVTTELKHRLTLREAPLLLPPKDYDTISRARGNLLDINDRRCMNLTIVGDGTGEATRLRNSSEESGIDLASPASDGGDVVSRFAGYQQPLQQPASRHASLTRALSGGSGSDTASSHVADTGDFVYTSRQERVGAGVHPRAPVVAPGSPGLRHGPHPSQTSPFGTHSSRGSDGNRSGGNGGGGEPTRFPPAYSRSNSSNSMNVSNPSSLFNQSDPFTEEGFIPPTDYDDDDGPPVVMRSKAFPLHAPLARTSSGSGSNSPMLMRSLPASVMQSEMALHSPRSPRGPPVDGDQYFYGAQRHSQPVYASQGGLDRRPQSADYGAPVRRVNLHR